MSELANYSVETDHTVLLAFKDGRKLRVPTGQLAHYLTKPDLEKVMAAIKLRRDFIQRHMPKIALLVAGVGLIGLLTVGGRAVAQLINPPHPVDPTPERTEVVRNQIYPTPTVNSPMPSPAVKGATVVTASASTPAPAHTVKPAKNHSPKPKSLPTSIPQTVTNLILPLPSILPNPLAGSTQPSPTPLPTPQVPNQNGQVLGDSTGPTPSPSPSPSPSPGPLANITPAIP